MANTQLFTHNPLPNATPYRLVRLADEAGEDFRAFEISEHEAGYLPCYTALSHRWGSDLALETILLNGKYFQVRQNLWRFLNQLCLENDHGYYWIDALCINQNDALERNRYVIQVGELYSCAQKVLIWLGHYESLERCAMELLESRTPAYLSEEDDATRLISRSNLCSTLLKMQYWSRAWIIQEILLARTVVLKCRSQQLTVEYLYQYCFEHMTPQPDVWRLERAWTLLYNIKAPRAVRWVDWLLYIADQECADPRDKAYSFLGLYHHEFGSLTLNPSTDIDYRMNVATVYWDCVYTLLISQKNVSYEAVKRCALNLRRWLEKVLGLTPIENVRVADKSYISVLEDYMLDESISDKHKALAEVTWTTSIAYGLVWAAAPTCLPFKSLVFACDQVHNHTDMQGAAMLVPSNHAADNSPIYNHLTSFARSRSKAQWQCKSCFRIVGDFFLSDNQLRNQDSDDIPLVRSNDKGKQKVIRHNLFTVFPWHESIGNCADCAFVEFAIVKQLRAACTRRDWLEIPARTGPPDRSDGYDTIFSPHDRFFYYQAAHQAYSVIVLWIEPGPKLSVVHADNGPHTEGVQQGSSHESRYIWFMAKRPQSKDGCRIEACSARQPSAYDSILPDQHDESMDTIQQELERASSSGTDGALSAQSSVGEDEDDDGEESVDNPPEQTTEEEVSSIEKAEMRLAIPGQVITSDTTENASPVNQGEPADPKDEALYNDSFAAWLVTPPSKKPLLPLQPLPRRPRQ